MKLGEIIQQHLGEEHSSGHLVYVRFQDRNPESSFRAYPATLLKSALKTFEEGGNPINLKPLFWMDKKGKVWPLNHEEESK